MRGRWGGTTGTTDTIGSWLRLHTKRRFSSRHGLIAVEQRQRTLADLGDLVRRQQRVRPTGDDSSDEVARADKYSGHLGRHGRRKHCVEEGHHADHGRAQHLCE